jgi:hypothetical protein
VQPKIPADLARQLNELGLEASCYQPVGLFVKNGRKLPNVAEPCDPWHVVLRREDRVPWADGSYVVQAVGPTLREAVEWAINLLPKPGLMGAVADLGRAVDGLAEAIHACQA